jgi:dihydroorotase
MVKWKDKGEFWIVGAKVVDTDGEKPKTGSVHIRRGKIEDIVRGKTVETDIPIFNADGLVLTPGFIDIHTHLREPGYEEKETIATGTAEAAAGGYTSVVCMANTRPVIDDPSLVRFILEKAELEGKVNVYPVAALTRGLEGKDINEYGMLKDAGAVALSDDGRYVTNSLVMRSAMEHATMNDLTVISHCEDSFLTEATHMNEGFTSTRLGMRGSPAAAEEIAVARDIRLAELTGAHLHVAHVSTAGSVKLIKKAKSRGVRVTAEVTPHHLTLDDSLIESFDTSLKVNPPLRGKKDIEAVRRALGDGIIDSIATDHAPHNEIDKQVEFDLAPAGMIGLGAAFAHLHTELVVSGKMELKKLIDFITVKPADVLGIEGGYLRKGATADLTLVDTEEEWTYGKEHIRSKSYNTPLIGAKFKGRVQGIFLAGKWLPSV